ncbi:hypothetical protein GYMLUDRAFT_242813, partial [Collybiopsis luxurians FD-317 M1]
IWDAETGDPHGQPLQGHTSSVYSVAFSPDGKRIASGSEDHSVRIWNAETGEPQGQPLQGHTSSVLSIAFSPDGKRLVSGAYDSSVWIWDMEIGQLQRKLQGHTSLVHAVAFSSDGKRVVSGSHDTSIRIWNLEATGIKPVPEQEYPSGDQALIPAISQSNGPSSTLSFCPWHPGHNYPHPTDPNPTLTVDGWLQNFDSSLLMWIPPEYRTGLMFPPMQILISKVSPVSLNLKDFTHGENWIQCCSDSSS